MDQGKQGTPQTSLRNRNTSHSKYEAIMVLAKKGMDTQQVVGLTMEDIVSDGKSMSIKGVKLTMEEAKVIAAYLHEHGAGIVSYVFYGNDATVQCSIPSLRKALGTHLKRTYGATLEDIGWNSVRTVPTPLVIESFDDVSKLIQGLKAKKTPS